MARKVLIYGGSGGIGAVTGRILKADGYALHLVARNEERLSLVAAELGASYTVGDVRDNDLFERAAQDAGKSLHGLVYAVGTISLGAFTRFKEEHFLKDFQINALGAARAVQESLSALKASYGTSSVVLFSTVAVKQGFKFHSSIGMAKGAVNGLTLSLAAELAPDIRVNAVAPSLTRTPLAHGLLSNEKTADAIAAMHSLPRLGTPEDVAALTAFLISEKSDWMTGQVLSVDGGRSTLRTG